MVPHPFEESLVGFIMNYCFKSLIFLLGTYTLIMEHFFLFLKLGDEKWVP